MADMELDEFWNNQCNCPDTYHRNLCVVCDIPLLHHEEEAQANAQKCGSCTLMQRKLECFYPLLEAAKMALDVLPNFPELPTFTASYDETRTVLMQAIYAFEKEV